MNQEENERRYELLNDGIPTNKVSNCCGARVYAPGGDLAICLDCKEHCEAVEEEDESIKK